MKKQPTHDKLRAAAQLVAMLHEAIPSCYPDHAPHDLACAGAKMFLEATHGARIRDDWRGGRLTMLGRTATCTSGFRGAMSNWAIAARKNLAAAA